MDDFEYFDNFIQAEIEHSLNIFTKAANVNFEILDCGDSFNKYFFNYRIKLI